MDGRNSHQMAIDSLDNSHSSAESDKTISLSREDILVIYKKVLKQLLRLSKPFVLSVMNKLQESLN